MKLFAWALVVGGALAGCADDSDTKPSFSWDPDTPPARSRPVGIDPVCGETVDPSTPWKGEFRDNLYSFHSEACRQRFFKAPDYYAYGQVPAGKSRLQGQQAYFTDPVCGRETASTRWSAEYGGRTYFFHDGECQREFNFHARAYAEPERRYEAR